MPENEAHNIGEAVLKVLRGRRGFYGFWDDIDPRYFGPPDLSPATYRCMWDHPDECGAG